MWRKGRDKNLPPCLETFKILYDVKDRMKLSCCLCPFDFFVYFSNLISGLISLLNISSVASAERLKIEPKKA